MGENKMSENNTDYKVEDLLELLKQDESWEPDEHTRIMIAEAIKGMVINF